MLNVEQFYFFFLEHDVLLKIKVPVSAICGIAYCVACVTWVECVKKDIENEIANILEMKLLKHRKNRKLAYKKKECGSIPPLQFNWSPAGFINRGMVDEFQMTLTRLCSDLEYTVLEISWLTPRLLVMAACMQQTQHVANDR